MARSRTKTYHRQYPLIPSHAIEVVPREVIWSAATRLFTGSGKPVALMPYSGGLFVVEGVAESLEWASLAPVERVGLQSALWVYRKASGQKEGFAPSSDAPLLLVVQGGRFDKALDYARGVFGA